MKPIVSCGLALLLAIAVGCGGGEKKSEEKKDESAAKNSAPTTQVQMEIPEGHELATFEVSGMS